MECSQILNESQFGLFNVCFAPSFIYLLGKRLKRLGMLAGLLFSSLIAGSLSKFTNLQPGAFVKTLGQDCKLEKFKVGPESSFLLESANFLTEYAPNLACKEFDSTWHNELINKHFTNLHCNYEKDLIIDVIETVI